MGTSKLMDVLATSTWASGFKSVTCSSQGCSRWLTQRHLSTRRVGVNLRNAWYCSYRCFAAAAQERFGQLLVSSGPSAQPGLRTPLGLTMVRRGVVNDDQFRTANEEMKKTGGEMGDILMRFGFVDEKQLTTVRASQWGCPVYTVSSQAPGSTSTIQIPSTFLSLYSMIPLHHAPITNSLLVGFVQGIEYGPLYAIEQVTGCKAQPCFITPTDYCTQMEMLRTDNALEEMSFDSVQSPREMTRLVCNYGALLDADQVAIVRCREFIWARITGGPKSADLLFKAE